jgi:valyl-tRNA synthetase
VSVLNTVLQGTLKLLHPFMPFITEEIFQTLPGTQGSIMVSAWPVPGKTYAVEEKAMANVMELIRGIRNMRAEKNVPANKRAALKILAANDARADYEMCAIYIERLGFASSIEFITDKSGVPENAVSVIGVGAEAFIPLGELIDLDKEIARLSAEEARLENEIKRAEAKLNNPGFTGKAPAAVIEEEREKLGNYRDMLAAVAQRKSELKK